MKKSLLVVLAIVMAFAMVGCGGSEETTNNVIELEFLQWWAAESGGVFYENLIKEFEAEHPNIKIKLVTLPFGDTRTQIVASHATKTTPDIVGMNPPWAREFYDLGILAPLDDLMSNDEDFNKEDYFQASFTPIEGKAYLAPINSMGFFLLYNKALFAENNLEPPKNWNELVQVAKALTDPSKQQYGITMAMSEQGASNGSILTLYPLLYAQNGRTLIDGKYTVETEEMVRAFELLEQLNTDGSILPGTTSKTEVQTIEEFSLGNIGMMISHNGHILTVNNRNPDFDLGIMPIPTFDGTGTPELRHHGWDIGIAASSEHKEEAWEFISFMMEKENMVRMSNELLKVPAMYDVEVDYLAEYPVVGEAIDYMNDLEMVEELMMMPRSGACWVELTKAGSAVMQGVMTPQEAVSNVQESWNKLLEQ